MHLYFEGSAPVGRRDCPALPDSRDSSVVSEPSNSEDVLSDALYHGTMSPPVTSSPIKPVNSSDMNDANIWCGGDNSKVTSNSKQIRNMRQTVEAELQNLALAGDTHKLIKLLEDGAPFVIDMVRFRS